MALWSLSPTLGSCAFCASCLCTALTTYCFWRIYTEARTPGIWVQGYYWTRGTLLDHTLLTTLYVSPVVVFPLDTVLTKLHHTGARPQAWLMAANSAVLMVLPHVTLPHLHTLLPLAAAGEHLGPLLIRKHSDSFTISQSYRLHSLAV